MRLAHRERIAGFTALLHGVSQICSTVLVLGLVTPGATAQQQLKTLDRYFHTAWTGADGAPTSAEAITQTADGYLWFGTATGLVRFDGVRFDRYESSHHIKLPSLDVSALVATPDGGLWIGYRTGGASFLKAEKIVNYGEREGLPSAQVRQFARDATGVVWATTSRGLYRFQALRWETVGPNWGFPAGLTDSLTVDRFGTLWVAGFHRVLSLDPGARAFVDHPISGSDGIFFEVPDGTMWVGTSGTWEGADWPQPVPNQSSSTRRASLLKPRLVCCSSSAGILAQTDGAIWENGAPSRGIGYFQNAEALRRFGQSPGSMDVSTFTHADGLSDDSVNSFFEDRERNIWITTRKGLDRFRARNVLPASPPAGNTDSSPVLAVDKSGAIWTAATNEPLKKIDAGVAISIVKPFRETFWTRPISLYCARDGAVWLGNGVLTKYTSQRAESIPLPQDVGSERQWSVRAITEDASGRLWVSIVQHGVYRRRGTVWEPYGGYPELPRLTAVSLWTDPRGRIWVGYTDNRIALLDGDLVRIFSSTDGVAVGNLTSFGGREGHVWAGGPSGLARFDGNRFHMFTTSADRDFTGISGIVETETGDLWLNQASGVGLIPAAEIKMRIADPGHSLQYELFDVRDGLSGTAPQLNSLPSAVAGTDGRIWVSTTEGLSWIDPAKIQRNRLQPPVSIESMVVDGITYPAGRKINLPPLPSNLEIDYAGLSLSIPERVRFRYRLEGIDMGWRDVGTRRSAFYTKLGPGAYAFRVIASNNDGVWNEVGATLQFVIAPAFYQTWWFVVLSLAAVAFVLWLLYAYRLRMATAQVRGRLGAQLEERERIARELHDTLLQGFQDLMLRFQAVMKTTLSDPEAAHRMMAKALDRADDVLAEGRQRVRDLREEGLAGNDLPQALTRCAEELSQDIASRFSLSVLGTPQPLVPTVFNEVSRIAREAVTNAFWHAKASSIEVELTYDTARVCLRVRDDGKGIDQTILNVGKKGHWGLSGMRERAEKIGAPLKIWSQSGAGTEVELVIPAQIAYPGAPSKSFWTRIRTWRNGN